MRVLSCKVQFPSFICFCKPSSLIYTPGPLKLDNSTPNGPSKLATVPEASDRIPCESENNEVKEEKETLDGKKDENFQKSNLRKPALEPNSEGENKKKKVQWMDSSGKELFEIREFESSEMEDTDYEVHRNRSCLCTIL